MAPLVAAVLLGFTLFLANGTSAAAQAGTAAGNHIAAGDSHTCMVTSSGGVSCWGKNDFGQLGNGTTTNSNIPVNVTGISNAVSIAAGYQHSCALTATGGVKCWGNNAGGRLGNGTSTNSSTPVDVSGLTSGAVAVDVSWSRSCVINASGGVLCWGGGFGSTPQPITGLASGVIAVDTSYEHTCALLNTGGVKCWGRNYWGQLGDGTTTPSLTTPVDVVGLSSGVIAIAVSSAEDPGFDWWESSCALMQDGTVKCWGSGELGQLGDGNETDSSTPVDVTGLSGSAAAIVGEGATFCALLLDGSAECWGRSGTYVGAGNSLQMNTPVPAMSGLTGLRELALGEWQFTDVHSCVIPEDGSVLCTGQNSFGSLGNGDNGSGKVWYQPTAVNGVAAGGALLSANVEIAKSDPTPYPPVTGQPVQYTIWVTNTGLVDLTNLTVTDLPSADLTMTALSSTPSGTCTVATNECTLDAPLASGASASFLATFDTGATAGAVISNTAYATADELPIGHYPTAAVVTVKSVAGESTVDLAITKSAGLTQATSGTTFDYTLTVVNNGPDNATNVVATDVLPAGFTFNSASATGGGSCSESGGSVTCTWSTVNNGTTVTATINVTS